ncbi:MinD/ParA family protein [Velocimicrobium porci]|uniref:MinD/ParA family protein n=1 Tax=Velocimicrobium porci TaxID=2606634 RepID=A0A6L5XYG0_9FIRM|nr:MinD/ParA family protein [Velocimicrobium porci]MSS62993.1 MinD/ParA family protein [Velocimicrobium porci]
MDQATQLRNIIKCNQQRPVARVITVTSGKGGVGKSSISVNLALNLQALGKRVVILDADFGLANVEIMLGVRPRYNLADLIYNGKNLKQIITDGPNGIGFLSGGSGIQELVNLSREQIITLTNALCELDEIADVIIVDTGAGISDVVMEFIAASSEVLLVVTPEPTSMTDSYALLKTLSKREDFLAECIPLRMISNRVETISKGKELYDKLNVVVNKFLNINIEFLGAVPQDSYFSKAVFQQNPVTIAYPKSISAQAISELAFMINNNEIIEQQMKKGISQIFSNLFFKLGQ